MGFELFVLIVLVLVNGLFSMSELAIVSARKGRLQAEANEGRRGAQVALDLANEPHTFLPTVQVGITLIGIVAGVYGGATLTSRLEGVFRQIELLAPYAREISYGLVVTGITYLSLVLGELLPKRLALIHPEAVAKLVGPLMRLLSRLFAPLVWILEHSTELAVRFLPISTTPDVSVTEDEIQLLIEQGRETGIIEHAEEQIVRKVFRLGDRPASSVMTPRSEMVWIDLNDSLDTIWQEVIEAPHSYFPAGKNSIEEMVGILSIKDIALAKTGENKEPLEAYVKEPVTVPSSITVLQVLERLKESRRHVAIVIDEYGGVDGLITAHDLMEAMVGEFSEEGEEPEYVRRPDGSLLMDATLDIGDVCRIIGLNPSLLEDHPGYHSLGGFVVTQLGRIPMAGERFEFGEFEFEIVDMDRHRVDKVLVIPKGSAALGEKHS